jgi:hypothetical protein
MALAGTTYRTSHQNPSVPTAGSRLGLGRNVPALSWLDDPFTNYETLMQQQRPVVFARNLAAATQALQKPFEILGRLDESFHVSLYSELPLSLFHNYLWFVISTIS